MTTTSKTKSPLAAPLPIAIYIAQHAAAPQLYEWITALPIGVPGPFAKLNAKPTFASDLANALLARGDPLVDIALSGSCDDHETLLALWRRGDHAVRYAIAANPYRIGYFGLDASALRSVVEQPDDELLRLVFTNPSMTSPALGTLFKREGAFASVDGKAWLRAVRAAARAPVLTSDEPLEVWADRYRFARDGWGSYNESLGFTGAWGLVDMLEPTAEAAEALEHVLLNISRFSPSLERHGYGSEEAMDRGRSGELSNAAQKRFVHSALQKWRRENAPGDLPPLRQFEADYHAGVRTAIARAVAKVGALADELRASDDKSTRIGAYGKARTWTDDVVIQAYKRDGRDFLREAVGNPAFHERGAVRDKLRHLIDQFGQDPQSSRANAVDDLQDLRHTFRLVGERLWKRDWSRYPAPYEDLDGVPDIRPDYSLTLTERVEKIERGISDSVRRTLIFHRERIEAGGATREEAEDQIAPLWAIRDAATSLAAAMKQVAGGIEAQQTTLNRLVVPGATGLAAVLPWICVFALGFVLARYGLK